MLRINLLPPYVSERKYGRWVFMGCIVLFLFTTIPTYIYARFRDVTLQSELDKAQLAEDGKKKTDDLKAQAVTIRASIGPIKAKTDFVAAVYDYNVSWARIYSKMANYTDPKITYSDASVGGTTMSLRGYTPSTSDVARYLQEITKDPDFTSVQINRVPGWGQAYVNKYYLDGKLIGMQPASTANPYANVARAAAAGGGPGGGGPPAGFGGGGPPPGFGGGGGPPAGFGAPGVGGAAPFSAAGPGGPALGARGVKLAPGERLYTLDQVLGDQINPLSATQRAKVIRLAMQRVVVKQVQSGYDFSLTCSLKKAFTPPLMPGGVGAAAGGARAGGPPPGFGGG